ncbi:MAG: hypothetical protein WD381_04880 [Balneolaceae bacterium]
MSGIPEQVKAQQSTSEQEVLLQFRYQGVVNEYVSTLYVDEQFYLSISEFFNALRIDHQADTGNLIVTGRYLEKGNYTLDFQNRQATFNGRTIRLTADDYITTEFGFYITPEVLNDLFGLDFLVDFGNLTISLQTDDTMPVVAQRERERQRERISRTQRELYRSFYPLQYDRQKNAFRAGFIDYNLTGNYTDGNNSFLFNTAFGAELAGGDLQGTVFGNISETSSSLRSTNLRWRYGVRDNDYLSRIIVGQSTAQGLSPVSYTGVHISNEPIEPRFLYDQTVFSGSAEPDSEVELYRNNTLVDFQQADPSGNYRFVVPLTYGTSSYSIRTYSPTGQMNEREARIQVPFNFLPPGEVNYTVDAGRLDNPLSGSLDRGLLTKANVAGGLANWLTAEAGVEYFEDFHTNLPTFSGGLSSRFLTNYLVSLEAANDAFYRANLSVIYPSAASISTEYTYFNRQGGIYNPGRNVSRFRTNIFTPFSIGEFPLFFRWAFTSEVRETSRVNRYRVDLNTRLGRTNIRLGYSDSQIGTLAFETSPTARITGSMTYTLPRSRSIPSLIRGVFTRAQLNYIPSLQKVEDAELQFSRSFLQQGRFQLSAGRNFVGNFNFFRFGLTFDFNRVRSSTTARSTRGNFNATQSIRGSAGFDSNNKNTLFTNRQQVGRSGVAVRLFIDNNNSGTFDDGDELIPERVIRVERAGGRTEMKNGINYITQLQPYRQYNLAINKSAISNPLVVPSVENFSIVTDPNQYKPIDIPFYTSGIIDGRVNRSVNGEDEGVGGLRLFLTQVNTPEGMEPHTEELRTFSDGSFYGYEIPPGDYELEPQSSQLEFLNLVANPEKLLFTVEALAEGDFKEGMEIKLVTDEEGAVSEEPPEDIVVSEEGDAQSPVADHLLPAYEQYSSYVDSTLRLLIDAQNAFYEGEHLEAIELINESLEKFETAQAYALKGSIYYLLGNKMEAQRNWELSLRNNPNIFIPDEEVLDQVILSF